MAESAVTKLPGLPPEIWDHIFDLATRVPYTLVPEIYEKSSIMGRVYNRQYHPELRAALVTKRSLVLVCRKWWHMAIRHLYRAIYIGRVRCLSSLSDTLRKYATGEGTMTEAEPLGRWTRRLDFVVRGLRAGLSSEAEHYLAKIINNLHNLEIVSFEFTSSFSHHQDVIPFYISNALRQSASSLRVLDWTTNLIEVQWQELAELLRRSHQLRILHFPNLFWFDPQPLESILSSVNTLALLRPPSLHSYPTKDDLENACISLREVILDVEIMRIGMPLWSEFMSRYGVSIISVQLRDAIVAEYLNDYLDMANRWCPNLRKLTLSFRSLLHISVADLHLPPVEYLGLIWQQPQPRSAYKDLLSSLATVKSRIPSLQVVQFLDFRNVQWLLIQNSRAVIRTLKRSPAGSGFRVEDHEGNLMSELITIRGNG